MDSTSNFGIWENKFDPDLWVKLHMGFHQGSCRSGASEDPSQPGEPLEGLAQG